MMAKRPMIDTSKTLGPITQCRFGRLPGVCGFHEYQLIERASAPGKIRLAALGIAGVAAVPGGALAAPSATTAVKTYTLPAPTLGTNKALKARKSTWKDTFPSRFRAGDVEQQEILNCYLAATLAALAHTPKGQAVIKKIVVPKQGKIVTTCHDYDFDGTKGPTKKITSDRYFEVQFQSGSKLIVSDVLYMDDSDRNWNPRYMTSHSDNALWPCIIEVAYASFKGGYEKIDASSNINFADFLKPELGSSLSSCMA